MENTKPITQENYLGSYLKRLIERAVNNPLFENNQKGNYRISPQHGANIYVYNLYKNDKYLASFTIYPYTSISGDYKNASKKEQTEIFETLKNLYPKFPIVFREYQAV